LLPHLIGNTCQDTREVSILTDNRLFNFLISFFSTLITNDIDYFYGLIFGGCCFALFFIVYFFMIETKDRSLEEIDTMYVLHVNPITSAKWDASSVQKEGLVVTDRLRLGSGGRHIEKGSAVPMGGLLNASPEEQERKEVADA